MISVAVGLETCFFINTCNHKLLGFLLILIDSWLSIGLFIKYDCPCNKVDFKKAGKL